VLNDKGYESIIFGGMWKEGVVTRLKLVTQNVGSGTEENIDVKIDYTSDFTPLKSAQI
jgi:hypothetical protein